MDWGGLRKFLITPKHMLIAVLAGMGGGYVEGKEDIFEGLDEIYVAAGAAGLSVGGTLVAVDGPRATRKRRRREDRNWNLVASLKRLIAVDLAKMEEMCLVGTVSDRSRAQMQDLVDDVRHAQTIAEVRSASSRSRELRERIREEIS